MRKEKIIRSQARDSLKGNWTAAVAGVFVLLAVIFILEASYELLCLSFGVFSDEKIKSGYEFIYIAIVCFVSVFAFAVTPFINGYFRLCYNIACERSDGLRDIFYFFSGIKQYFKALLFNFIIALKTVLYTIISFIPYTMYRVFKDVILGTILKTDVSSHEFTAVIEIILFIIGVALAILISIRLFIYEFVFVDNFEANVFGISKILKKNHLRDYYKLVFSFIFWILSCFFVLPGLYVIPYFMTSLGTTSKWLINLYKEGKTV